MPVAQENALFMCWPHMPCQRRGWLTEQSSMTCLLHAYPVMNHPHANFLAWPWPSHHGLHCSPQIGTCRRRSGSHPDLRVLSSLQSSPSGSGQLTGMGAGHARRRSSEDDVFGAAGGLELGSDRSEAATARCAGMNASSSADSLPHVESRGSVASGIGDLPPGDPPSRTLLIRNIQPTISDESLQATFAVSPVCCRKLATLPMHVTPCPLLMLHACTALPCRALKSSSALVLKPASSISGYSDPLHALAGAAYRRQ